MVDDVPEMGATGGQPPFDQRKIPETPDDRWLSLEGRPDPDGRPPRPRTWLGAVVLFVFLVLLAVVPLAGDCSGEQVVPEEGSPSPTVSAVTSRSSLEG